MSTVSNQEPQRIPQQTVNSSPASSTLPTQAYSQGQSPQRHGRSRKKAKTTEKANLPTQPKPTGQAGNSHPLIFWDCSNIKFVPTVQKVKKLHIYDFDNTLFKSPCPNPSLYNESTTGLLCRSEPLNGGGWWSNPLVLRNVGEGWDIEKQRGWESFWNEDVVDLMKISTSEEDTLTIVMTGRKKDLFSGLITEMLTTKGLAYDALILKHSGFDETLTFKNQVLIDILQYYYNINHVTFYDDRRSQLNGFQACLNEYVEAVRPDLTYSLIPVFTQVTYLDPKIERQLIEEYVEYHNEVVESGKSEADFGKVALRKGFFYSAYVIETESKAEIIKYVLEKFSNILTPEVLTYLRFQPNFIPISRSKLNKEAAKLLSDNETIEWKVTKFGYCEQNLFVVQVESWNENGVDERPPTQLTPPLLAIAGKGKSQDTSIEEFMKVEKYNWIPVTDQVIIRSTFGHIFKLKVASQNRHDHGSRGQKRPRTANQ